LIQLTRIVDGSVLHASSYPDDELEQVKAKHEDYLARREKGPAKGKDKQTVDQEPTRGRQVVRASAKTPGARSRSRKPVPEGMCHYSRGGIDS
jgi:hypothetical protein